jgi:F-type H+-transporting ATPase subunit a
VILCVAAVLVNLSLKSGDPLIPKDPSQMGFADWVRTLFETVVETFMELVDSLMPHHHQGRHYLWLLVPIFFYILTSNFIGLVPGFTPPSDNINTNAAVAVSVFVFYQISGFREVGPGYLKHFWAPPGLNIFMAIPIGIMLGGIELISHMFRPVTLSLRLYGNMQGDHTAFATFLALVPIGVPMVFLMLGMLIGLVQAYVFTLLSSIYLALATSHDH